MKTKIIETFLDLVKISSPSGKEAMLANYIKEKMIKSGFTVWFDDAQKVNGSDTGNLYAYFEVNKSKQTLVFSAHMDTVQKDGEVVKPVMTNGFIESDGKTILGADDKAGVAVLLIAADVIDKKQLKHNLLFFFPTCEEAGIMGSSQFMFDKSKIKYVFNLDSSDKPGVFIYKSLGYENFDIVVKGISAHAAKHYEDGIDAIKAAGLLISKIPTGTNMEEGWTLNIGKITGGAGTNVVCDEVVLKGEIRSFDPKVQNMVKEKIEQICYEVGMNTKAQILFVPDNLSTIPSFLESNNSDLVNLCKEVTESLDLDFVLKESFSTSDSNFYFAKGYKTISVSRGGENAHSKLEKIKIVDVKDALEIVLKILLNVE